MAPHDMVLVSIAIALLDDLEAAELAKAEADKRCDEALAKLAAIETLVGIGHGKDCYLWRTGRGRCTCKLGDIRAILHGTPEGKNG